MVAGYELIAPVESLTRHQSAIRTRRAFFTMGIAAVAGYGGWSWLRSRPEIGEVAWPFRRMLQFNQRVAQLYYAPNHAAPVFPPSRIQGLRVNGDVGLGHDFDPQNWSLNLKQLANPDQVRRLTMADIRSLPAVEYTAPLKCIEGWSDVIKWTGVRFSDFTRRFAPESTQAHYVSLHTPDEQYFVGLDMASALHPQTLLCYQMNGEPLTSDHGAPLRLVIPVKYGIKNIKRIGTIAYTADQPSDYWAEEGYDWYAGL
ncbi:MAG: molybdopterin-dependent oxidoreductase [Bryobacterales bacterium]|nr:molybdopterin-dependent oxidoreductase [Bryobacterales bacterium]